jgi:hypothetical protein
MKNPNAVIGGGSGLGGGTLVVYLLSIAHVSVSAYAGIAIASGVTGVVLWFGREGGLDGIWNKIIHGTPAAPKT